MSSIPTITEKTPTVVSGSASYVTRKLNKIPDEDGLKAIAIIFQYSSRVQISQIARALKKSSSVRRLLSGVANYEFYQMLIEASLPKKFPKPKLLIQAEKLASSKK